MRIVALGGCGLVGAAAVKAALDVTEAEEIVIADQNGESARKMAEALGDRVTSAEVNVEDAAGLESLFADRDIVLSTVGPYFRFGLPVLKAAIRSNTHYVDINDDWEPTLDMLECHQEARKAGITAIVGVGISPGIMNLMAVRAMRELDTVDTIYTVWSLDAIIREYMEAAPQEASTGSGVTSAAAVHLRLQRAHHNQTSDELRAATDSARTSALARISGDLAPPPTTNAIASSWCRRGAHSIRMPEDMISFILTSAGGFAKR